MEGVKRLCSGLSLDALWKWWSTLLLEGRCPTCYLAIPSPTTADYMDQGCSIRSWVTPSQMRVEGSTQGPGLPTPVVWGLRLDFDWATQGQRVIMKQHQRRLNCTHAIIWLYSSNPSILSMMLPPMCFSVGMSACDKRCLAFARHSDWSSAQRVKFCLITPKNTFPHPPRVL